MILNYDEWTPDSPDFNAPGIISIKNLIPHPNGYRGFPGQVVASSALTARFQGGFSTKDASGNAVNYAGDATKLYSLPTNTTWTNATRLAGGAYTLATDQQWEFARWGNTLIATNVNDVMQVIPLVGANFAVMKNFQTERIALAAMAVGHCTQAIKLTLDYVRQRQASAATARPSSACVVVPR